MLLWAAIVHLLLLNLPRFVYSNSCWIFSCFQFELLWIKLFWFMYSFFCGLMFSFPLEIHLGVEFLDRRIDLYLLKLLNSVPKGLCPVAFPPGTYESSSGSTFWPILDVINLVHFSHSAWGMEGAHWVVFHSCWFLSTQKPYIPPTSLLPTLHLKLLSQGYCPFLTLLKKGKPESFPGFWISEI